MLYGIKENVDNLREVNTENWQNNPKKREKKCNDTLTSSTD